MVSHLTIIKKVSTNTSQISIGLALQLSITKVMAKAIVTFLAYEVVRARSITRTIKQKSLQFCLQVLSYDITLGVLAILASK